MARPNRSEVISLYESCVVHVFSRVVRRCFLLGDDPLTGKNYDHRKVWIEDMLKHNANYFAIDLLCFSLLSNHFHLILKSQPKIVATWTSREVARRWLMLCPKRKAPDGSPTEPKETEINSIVNDAVKLKQIRSRLSDISWWMRLTSSSARDSLLLLIGRSNTSAAMRSRGSPTQKPKRRTCSPAALIQML